MLRLFVLVVCLLSTGCSLLPEIAHQPTLHNPFPQLSKVAVAPFFNLSEEPTLDVGYVASAYFTELQAVPGFEVVPLSVVERAIRDHNIALEGPEDARRLAQILDVDAVLIGAVTEYTPYYPPRIGLQVEWYAANPYFHPIPPGYGLPWGTPDEEGIPASLVFEAEMALAKAQLETQTPPYEKLPPKPLEENPAAAPGLPAPESDQPPDWSGPDSGEEVRPLQYETAAGAAATVASSGGEMADTSMVGIPPDWPDPRGFIPPPPLTRPLKGGPTETPVIRHVKIYHGSDMEFTEALASYYFFRDDARYGGWQGYLQRSEDFVRFCCHMHIAETLTARGGAGETRVVWRWPTIR